MLEQERDQLLEYLGDAETRHYYLAAQIKRLLPLQIRSMREARGWTQTDLGDLAGMEQVRISKLEDPENPGVTRTTLLRLAKAFDVALVERFAPFSEFIDWTIKLSPAQLTPPSFTEEQQGRVSLSHTSTTSTIPVGPYAMPPGPHNMFLAISH